MTAITASEWKGILSRIQQEHPNLTRHWFGQLRGTSLDHGILEIRCSNAPQQRYLGAYCGRPFSEAAQAEIGSLVTVRFTLGRNDSSDGSNGVQGQPASTAVDGGSETIAINSEYTFDEFVTGPCNRLAHAACVAVGEAPGQTYNPLFIHGSVGLGKTHLLHAVCQAARQKRRDLKILFLSCETFANHFIEAVEQGALHQFRFRYRHVDILLIDDIQFLAERERSQEEFFHTFNTLHQARKQIVLSADCSPREIPSLEDRLVSRFNWGLVTRVDKACFETRIAILRKKSRRRRIELPEDVIHFMASAIDTNIRELEGAITAVDAYSQQLGRAIDLPLAQAALGQVEPSAPARPITILQILEAVAEHYNVKKSDLRGKRRQRSIARPRQVCMHLARDLTRHSLEEIGSYFGGRDHTTVMHANRQIAKLRDEDVELCSTLHTLKSQLSEELT